MKDRSTLALHTALTRRQVLNGLGTALAAGALAACTPPATPQPTVKPTVAAQQPTVQPTAAAPQPTVQPTAVAKPTQAKKTVTIRCHVRTGLQGDWFNKEVEVFNRNQDEVKVVNELTPDAEWSQKMSTLIAGGELGDVMWTGPFINFAGYSARGVFIDLKPLADAERVDFTIYLPQAIQQCTWQGKLTAFPLAVHAGISSVYTNLDMWKAAGASLPEWEWTYDKEWLPAVKQVTVDANKDGTPERYGFQFDYSAQATYTFIASWGGDWIDATNPTKSTLNSPEAMAGLMYMHDLVHKHKVSPPRAAVVPDMLANELTASYVTGCWFIMTLDAKVKGKFKWQTFAMPVGPAGRGSFFAADMLTVTSSSKAPAAAFKWIRWLTRPEAKMAQMTVGMFGPPARKEAWETPPLSEDVNYKVVYRWLKQYTRTPTLPGNARVSEFSTAYNQNFQAFMLDKDNPKAKLDQLHRAVQEVLDKPLL